MPKSNWSDKRKPKKVPPNPELLKPIEQQGWWNSQPGYDAKSYHIEPKPKIKVEFKLKQEQKQV